MSLNQLPQATTPAGDLLARRIEALGTRRLDSFTNSTTGIGSSTRDKRMGGLAAVYALSYSQCADLYRGNDMAARIADALPNDCYRKGWTIAAEGDEGREIGEKIDASLDELEAKKHLRQAHRWSRVFGGAGVFVGADDGQAADQPLDLERVKKVDFLLPLDAMELLPESYYGDALSPKYGLPMTYRLCRFSSGGMGAGTGGAPGALQMIASGITSSFGFASLPVVHESRILRFEGVLINRLTLRSNWHWGDSIYVRCYEVLRDFGLSWSSAAILLQDFAQACWKLPGFGQAVAKQGVAAYVAAAAALEVSRSTAGALILDAEDDFERKSTPTTGLPELLVQMSRRLAAAADMPVTRLFGESPAGLSATGEQDAAWWADKVAAEQEDTLRPALNRLVTILLAAKAGPTRGNQPENWKIRFHPLKQLDDLQQADRRSKIAQADKVYLDAGVVTPEEVAVSRFGGDEYNGDKLHLSETDPEKRALSEPMPGEGTGTGAEPEEEEPGEGTGGEAEQEKEGTGADEGAEAGE